MFTKRIKNIYDFIPSYDVRKLCRKIKHKFTEPEIYTLVVNCPYISTANKDKYTKKYVANLIDYNPNEKISCPSPFKTGDIITTTRSDYGIIVSPSHLGYNVSSVLFFTKTLDGNIVLKEENVTKVEFYRGNKTATVKKDIQEFNKCVEELTKERDPNYC